MRISPRALRRSSAMLLALACLSASPARAVIVSATNSDATRLAAGRQSRLEQRRANQLGQRRVSGRRLGADGQSRGQWARAVLRWPLVRRAHRHQRAAQQSTLPGSPDLRMFRLAEDPGLPTLEIDAVRPAAGSTVMMIGAGRQRVPGLKSWRVSGSSNSLDLDRNHADSGQHPRLQPARHQRHGLGHQYRAERAHRHQRQHRRLCHERSIVRVWPGKRRPWQWVTPAAAYSNSLTVSGNSQASWIPRLC